MSKNADPWVNWNENFTNTQYNRQAYDILSKAVAIGSIKSKKEAEEVQDICNEARKYINKTDPKEVSQLESYIAVLEYDVKYATSRHSTFSWQVIVGVAISLFLFNLCSGSHEKNVNKYEAQMANIEAWQSDTITTFERIEEIVGNRVNYEIVRDEYRSGAHFKMVELYNIVTTMNSAKKARAEFQAKLDTCRTENVRVSLAEEINEADKRIEGYMAEFNEVNTMPTDKLKERASKQVGKWLDNEKSSKNTMRFWFIFFLILTPIYIFASYPFGYQINKQKSRLDAVNGIQRFGVMLAGLLFGIGASIQFITIITKWSDGRTTSEDDGTGAARLAIKIGFFVAAILAFCLVSCFVMVISTIFGLINRFKTPSNKNG